MKKVFVSGGAGFIGRELSKKLIEHGHQVVVFDLGEQFIRHHSFFAKLKENGRLEILVGTVLDRSALLAGTAECDAVFHMAAMLGVKRTECNRLRCMEVNVDGTDNLLDACIRNRVKRFIFASSSEVYGEPNHNPIKESDDTKGKTVYAVSKLAGEELVKGYDQLYPWFNPTIVRFFNTYGEGQVAQFVLSKFVNRVMNGENPVVYGKGNQTRSYGHVDDVTGGLLKILASEKAAGEVYNLGNSTQVMTLAELAQKVIDVLAPNTGLKVEILGDFEGTDRAHSREIFMRYCDTSKAAKSLGYHPEIDVEEGIRRIAAADTIHNDWPFDP